MIAAIEAKQQISPRKREARFEDAAAPWMERLEFERQAKLSTPKGRGYLLAKPRRDGERQRSARIMREFEGAEV